MKKADRMKSLLVLLVAAMLSAGPALACPCRHKKKHHKKVSATALQKADASVFAREEKAAAAARALKKATAAAAAKNPAKAGASAEANARRAPK